MESNLIPINKNFSKFHHKIFQKKKKKTTFLSNVIKFFYPKPTNFFILSTSIKWNSTKELLKQIQT